MASDIFALFNVPYRGPKSLSHAYAGEGEHQMPESSPVPEMNLQVKCVRQGGRREGR